MSDVPAGSPRLKIAVRLSPRGLASVDRLAEEEDRTRSDMIRILLIEAIAMRERRLAQGNQP